MKENKKCWMLFDGRYRTDEDKATCHLFCDTLKEAKQNADDYGDDTVIVEAEIMDGMIINSKIIN